MTRHKKQDHFSKKPNIQKHVFRNNTGKCEACGLTPEQIRRFGKRCIVDLRQP